MNRFTLLLLIIISFDSRSQDKVSEIAKVDFAKTQIGINASLDVGYRLSAVKNIESINYIRDTSSIITKETKLHGVYIELLGKEMIYSIGYELSNSKELHTFGFGLGTSILRLRILGSIRYNQYSLSSYAFYEYGKTWGGRTAVNLNGKINPIMYSSKLDEVVPPDKPSYYDIIPSFSLGMFFRPKGSNFQYILSTYFLESFGKRQTFDGHTWRRVSEYNFWLGLTFKYNFKTDVK